MNGFYGSKPIPIASSDVLLAPDSTTRRYPVIYSRRDAPEGMGCLSFEEYGDELIIRLGERQSKDDPGLPIDKVRAFQVAEGLRQWAAQE